MCKESIDLAQKDAATGEIKGINWARAVVHICHKNPKSKQLLLDRKVETRNKFLWRWNLKHRGDAAHHVYYHVTGKTFQYLACQRPQCGLHIKPVAWPHTQYSWADKAFEHKKIKCSGNLTEWDKANREVKPKYLLEYPDVYGEEEEEGKKSTRSRTDWAEVENTQSGARSSTDI